MASWSRSRVLRIIGILSCALLIFIILGLVESYYERFEAKKLIAVVSEIQVGSTSEPLAKGMLRSFSRFNDFNNRREYPDEIDTGAFDQFTFSNQAFRYLRLSPATWIWVTLNYNNGEVTSKLVQYYEEPRCSGSVQEVLLEPDALKKVGIEGHHVYVSSSVPSPVFIMKVFDDATVPLARRQLDWQIDLACFTKIGGCRDPRKVLRGVMLEVP